MNKIILGDCMEGMKAIKDRELRREGEPIIRSPKGYYFSHSEYDRNHFENDLMSRCRNIYNTIQQHKANYAKKYQDKEIQLKMFPG